MSEITQAEYEMILELKSNAESTATAYECGCRNSEAERDIRATLDYFAKLVKPEGGEG